MDLGLAGRTALVTGSWRGTGAGIAEVLAREGASVLVHGLEPGQAEPVAEALTADGLAVRPVTGDITTDAGAATLVDSVRALGAPVDVLVNNYGVAEGGDWTTTPPAEWVAIYQKNVLSGVRLVQAFSDDMRRRGFGRIIFVGTVGGLRPAARMPHYYASKAVLPNLCTSLAKSLAGTGITVNLISPGIIGTAEVRAMFMRRAQERGWGTDWAEVERHAVREMFDNPLGRVALVAEVASLVAFVASERAGYINGAQLRIDGGAADCAV